jgi:hypothetical protein
VQYLSPAPLRFRQWDGYEPKPTREFPNQWHVEAGTTNRLGELRMLTVIVPHRRGAETSWRAERLESDSAIGARLVRGGETTLVAFRKADAGGATLGGANFDGPVWVERRGSPGAQ